MNKFGNFILCLCAFLVGVWVGLTWQIPIWILICPALLFFIISAAFLFQRASGPKVHRKLPSLLISCILFLFCLMLVIFRAKFSSHKNQFSRFFGQKVIIMGHICTDPIPTAAGIQNFEVCTQGYSQKILVTTFSRDNYFYGNYLQIIGKLKQPISGTGTFDYAKYLQSRNVYAEMSSPQAYVLQRDIQNPLIFAALKVKHFIFNSFFKYLSKEKAALLIAIILGQKGLLGKTIIDAFSAAGLVHIIAVSGYVLTLNLIFISLLRKHIGKRNAAILAVAVALLYVIMADFAAGFMRAAIMSII